MRETQKPMRYYVVADVHGFYDEMIAALKEEGFFEDQAPHKLIICGDLFDRGRQAKEMQAFVLDLLRKNEIIMIKGNHEDLFVDLIDNAARWMNPFITDTHHYSNGTVNTALQLTGMRLSSAIDQPLKFQAKAKETPLYKEILPKMLDYYETKKYIFVHGWIPCEVLGWGSRTTDDFSYQKNWRRAKPRQWEDARWINGMAAAYNKVLVPRKTIVCGHFHTSYGHAIIEKKGREFGKNADFSPYRAKGIIAIDACTAYSKKVNCLLLEDEELAS